MSELTTVARPYAKAAFDYAVEQKAIQEWQDMLVFAGEVAKNDEMSLVLSSAMASDKLAELFANVCGEQLDQAGQNLVNVLAENGRLKALPEIAVLFNQYKSDYEKEVDVEVTSAVKLTKKQQNEISASLETRLARKVKLNCNVDAAIVAGVIIKAGDTVIDGSVRSKLDRLTDALQS